ncbi:VTC domain-containing protein [Dysgonomonas sp. 216]|uniref:polyphosphate polymerase domain-containing protein n=1 Tax=Dysgonomonas sp. 216 TaxID=2302934 RepID=UPI0013D783F4|nr:polyphosphate polymerase domain-containing protein [Dysgonomonas sp. 216]NDW19791.1 VTC domain-containing protein [Dysgonomonas sp. 216]
MKLHLDKFDCISLSEMEGIRLMKRIDKKFVLPLNLLQQLLDKLTDDYFIQEIGNKRSFEYATLYYDTFDYEMFRAHQNGKLNRLKVRTREYVDSKLCFLEIKRKSNKGMTKKIRIANERPDLIQKQESSEFLSLNTPYTPLSLEPKLWSLYDRITLVNKAKTERLTIDYNLCFRNNRTLRKASLPNMVIIEIKRERASVSPVMDKLNQLRIKPTGMSKYCLGVVLTEEPVNIKTNAFKSKLININKITTIQYDN